MVKLYFLTKITSEDENLKKNQLTSRTSNICTCNIHHVHIAKAKKIKVIYFFFKN